MANAEQLLPHITAAAADAASLFCQTTGEKADSIPESVLQMSIYQKFAETYHLVPEMRVRRVWERNCGAMGAPMPPDLQHISNAKIDLAGLVVDVGSREKWTVDAVIELKRWEPSFDDQKRIDSLLKYVPKLRFGLRVTLIDQPSTDSWIQNLRTEAVENGRQFFVRDAVGCLCASGRQCSVIVEATYRDH